MNFEERVHAFERLGEEFSLVLKGEARTAAGKRLAELLPEMIHRNGWYSEKNLRHRLGIIAAGLKKEMLNKWLSAYSIPETNVPKTVAVIVAGNIPLVGFDDFLDVLISGNKFLGKLSSDDKLLLPLVAGMLQETDPRFAEYIAFEESRLSGMDAIIATGSNNSSRYFNHYFAKYPHIIRSGRTSVAVLTNTETKAELEALQDDIFLYFGLGCRNVTKLFVPENYDFKLFFEAIVGRGEELLENSKYMNNYDYHKALYLLAQLPLLDNNFLLLKEDAGLFSPPGVLFYESYSSSENLNAKLDAVKDSIQCVVAKKEIVSGAVPFGQAQLTNPSDYADGVDVMDFLLRKI